MTIQPSIAQVAETMRLARRADAFYQPLRSIREAIGCWQRQLAGKSVPEGLEAVEHHLAVCGECHEEYETLQQALQDMDEG